MRIVVFCLLMLALSPAFAAPVAIRDVPKYLDHQRDLRDDVMYSKKFKHVQKRDRERLYKAQDEIFSLLEGRASVDELSPDQLIALYDAQGVVNAVLEDAELDREVCKREKLVGSHRSSLVCMTVREQRRIKESHKTMMLAPRTCNNGVGGASCGG
ncbi:MAG TPA: hypothetical protein VFL14_01070 [Xanthomonadales bacterium]|nr:hypothetical protein [Xanthomonadales bacterium]